MNLTRAPTGGVKAQREQEACRASTRLDAEESAITTLHAEPHHSEAELACVEAQSCEQAFACEMPVGAMDTVFESQPLELRG